MRPDRYASEYSEHEINVGYISMLREMVELPYEHPIRILFLHAWIDFKQNKFKYDGPTFSKRRFNHTIFDVSSFIHDWRNSNGNVGKLVDKEMFSIMIKLDYHIDLISQRWLLTRLTSINVLRHKIKGTYVTNKPSNLYL
jgi:hypothetical protein